MLRDRCRQGSTVRKRSAGSLWTGDAHSPHCLVHARSGLFFSFCLSPTCMSSCPLADWRTQKTALERTRAAGARTRPQGTIASASHGTRAGHGHDGRITVRNRHDCRRGNPTELSTPRLSPPPLPLTTPTRCPFTRPCARPCVPSQCPWRLPAARSARQHRPPPPRQHLLFQLDHRPRDGKDRVTAAAPPLQHRHYKRDAAVDGRV